MGIVLGIVVAVLMWFLPPILIFRNKQAKASRKAIWAAIAVFSPIFVHLMWGLALSAFLDLPSITFEHTQTGWFKYVLLGMKLVVLALPWIVYIAFLKSVGRAPHLNR